VAGNQAERGKRDGLDARPAHSITSHCDLSERNSAARRNRSCAPNCIAKAEFGNEVRCGKREAQRTTPH